jgi:predicted  nucleic acid-binding Zn-ribbon protein
LAVADSESQACEAAYREGDELEAARDELEAKLNEANAAIETLDQEMEDRHREVEQTNAEIRDVRSSDLCWPHAADVLPTALGAESAA